MSNPIPLLSAPGSVLVGNYQRPEDMNYASSAMATETNYSAKHTTTGSGPAGPQPTATTLASNTPAACMAAQIGAHHPDGGAAQAPSDMGAFVNRFNTLGVNGAVPMFDANAMPVPLYFPGGLPGGLPSGAGIPIGHAQIPIQTSEGYYMPYNYAAQWATPAVPKDMDVRGMPVWPAHRVGDIVRPTEQVVAAQQDVPALDNRRSSYSTTESTPATPFFGSTASRDAGARVTVFDRSTYTTPSPQALAHGALIQQPKSFAQTANFADRDLDALLAQEPAIPHAVPAVFTPQENMKTLEQSLVNPIPGNRNVYIRGLHPTTDDDTLYKYAERFGRVETSKAIIDTATCACKGFGFAKFYDHRDSEACIRGFHRLGYEVGFARVNHSLASTHSVSPGIKLAGLIEYAVDEAHDLATIPTSDPLASAPEWEYEETDSCYGASAQPSGINKHRFVKTCGCHCPVHNDRFTDFDPWNQESFNSRLKAEGDDASTNLYISNLPPKTNESELAAIFLGYTILSSKILRDNLGNSRGVGFARFESRAICDEIIANFHNITVGDEHMNMQIRYADTPGQKELKRITAERRQFRTNEYNVGAYGTPLVGMSPTIYNQPGGWKRHNHSAGNGHSGPASLPNHVDELPIEKRLVHGENCIKKGNARPSDSASGKRPASEDGSSSGDEGVTVHIESPMVANGSTRSTPVKPVKEKD